MALVVAPDFVWRTLDELPDEGDRAEFADWLEGMREVGVPVGAVPHQWIVAGELLDGYILYLYKGNGFLPFTVIPAATYGEDVILLLPITWMEL